MKILKKAIPIVDIFHDIKIHIHNIFMIGQTNTVKQQTLLMAIGATIHIAMDPKKVKSSGV